MVDAADPTNRVICLVTYAALQDRATFDGNGDDWMRAWLEHREAIEALASYNYDHGIISESGEVVVETEDLTPIGIRRDTRRVGTHLPRRHRSNAERRVRITMTSDFGTTRAWAWRYARKPVTRKD